MLSPVCGSEPLFPEQAPSKRSDAATQESPRLFSIFRSDSPYIANGKKHDELIYERLFQETPRNVGLYVLVTVVLIMIVRSALSS